MAAWHDRFFHSADGIKLHYRDQDGGTHEQPPVLCLPGLTRNARDFEPLADHVRGRWRVISLEFRGRGMSGYDPNPANYHPLTYRADLLKLLDQLGIAEAVFVGTSLGGLVTMLTAEEDDARIAGALINDVGPVFQVEGIERIADYVGKGIDAPDWASARAIIAERAAGVYPDLDEAGWDRFVRRICAERGGRVEFDYDFALAEPFRALNAGTAASATAWPYWQALAGRPVTILRGALTDLLDAETAHEMVRRVPGAELVTVPRVGHTPTFEEPESLAALDRLLARVTARG